MSSDDDWIDELKRVSGLSEGDTARLIGVLLVLIFAGTGGFADFRKKFLCIGLADVFDSWVGDSPHMRYTNGNEIKSALGADTTQRVAETIGRPEPAVRSILAAAIPLVVRITTKGGGTPLSVPPQLLGFYRAGLESALPRAIQESAVPGPDQRKGSHSTWGVIFFVAVLACLIIWPLYLAWAGGSATTAAVCNMAVKPDIHEISISRARLVSVIGFTPAGQHAHCALDPL